MSSCLGGEVPVKYALVVEVLQPTGDVQRQTDPDAPREVQITVQQLLQIPSVYVLYEGRKMNIKKHNKRAKPKMI